MVQTKQSELYVVFCTASVGSGHVRAAEAVSKYFKNSKILDILNFTPKWFNKIYHDGYFFAVKHFPEIVGWFYDACDIPHDERGIRHKIICCIEDLICIKFRMNPELKKADVIVSTHFLTSGIISRMKDKGLLKAPIVTIVTDDYPHCIWLEPGIDLLCVANKASAEVAVINGIHSSIVRPTGIPIDTKFGIKYFKSNNVNTILVTGGGDGIGEIENVVKYLLEMKDLKIIAVCGKNKRLKESLDKIRSSSLEVIGYTDRMHELMHEADILICKPGGLTTTEALAARLPMILMKPIPGQEERNAKVLVESGAAMMAPQSEDICHVLKMIITNNKRLGRMRSSAFQMSNSNSAKIIAQLISDLRKS